MASLKRGAGNVLISNGKRAERCRLTGSSTVWSYQFHTVELSAPYGGTPNEAAVKGQKQGTYQRLYRQTSDVWVSLRLNTCLMYSKTPSPKLGHPWGTLGALLKHNSAPANSHNYNMLT